MSLLEESYKKFMSDLPFWIPEGITVVNLELLHDLDLLHFQPFKEKKEAHLSRYFHIIEESEKITLINDEFIIWITPFRIEEKPVTYTLIALNQGEQIPHLELAFSCLGIYNTSYLLLRVLEKFLIDIQETESLIFKLESAS